MTEVDDGLDVGTSREGTPVRAATQGTVRVIDSLADRPGTDSAVYNEAVLLTQRVLCLM